MHKHWLVTFVLGSVAIGSACGSVDRAPGGPSSLTSINPSGAVMGQKGKIRVLFTNPVSADTDVALSSGSPDIATVPDHVTVPSGAVLAEVEYTAVSPGIAVFEATAGEDTAVGTAGVVDMLRLTISSNATFEAGAGGIITPSLNIVLPETATVSLTSSQPSIARVDSEVTIPAFRSSGLAQFKALSPGASVITASLASQQAKQTLTVVDKARIVQVNGTQLFEVGGRGTVQVRLNAQLASAAQVAVTSSDPSVVSVASGTGITQGSNFANLDIQALAVGSTNVTFRLNGSGGTLPIAVLGKAQLEDVSVTGTPSVGDSTQLSVRMDVTAATDHDITLTSSDPTVISVPPTITVFAGTSTGSAAITPAKQGSAIITATFNGISRQTEVAAGIANFTLNLFGQNRLVVGATNSFSIQTGSGTPTLVSLKSSDATVIAVPPSIAVSFSEAVPMSILHTGTTTITATANGVSSSMPVTVVAAPAITNFGPTFTIPVNGQISGNMFLDTAPRAGTPLTFTTSDPMVAPAPDAIAMSSGQSFVPLTIHGGKSGTAILTATVAGSSATAVVYVGGSTTNAVFQSLSAFFGSTLELGAATVLSASFSQAPASPDTGTITFSNAAILNTPSPTIAIPAGSFNNFFPIIAALAGATDVTVTIGGISQSAHITVVSAPTFTIQDLSSVKVGAVVSARIVSDAMLATERAFSLTSSNTAIATVTNSTATIGPGNSGGQQTSFGVRGVAAGTATITATNGTKSITATVTVAP